MSRITNFVDWSEIEEARISVGSPETKTPAAPKNPNEKQGAPYAMAKINYLYKMADGSEIKDDFAVQMCEVKCFGILKPKPGFKDTQINSNYMKDRDDVKKCMEKMNGPVHARLVDLVCQPNIKGNLKAEKVDPDFAKMKGIGIQKFIPWKVDKLTTEADKNKNPSVYYKLNSYESTKTIFSIINEKMEITNPTWEEIENADFSGKPILHYKNFYSNGNGNVVPQATVASFAITDIKYKGSGNPQAEELKKMAVSNPDMVKNVTAGYKELIEKMSSAKNPQKQTTTELTTQSIPLQSSNSTPIQSTNTQPPTQLTNTQPPTQLTNTQPPTQLTNTQPSIQSTVSDFMRSGNNQQFSGHISNDFTTKPQPNQASYNLSFGTGVVGQ